LNMNDSHTEKDIRELPGTYQDGEPSDPATDPDHSHKLSWRDISRVVFVAAAAGAIWFLHGTSNADVIALGVI
jgi:hypothetical protein